MLKDKEEKIKEAITKTRDVLKRKYHYINAFY